MLRLTINNIHFVKELTRDGIPYSWFVSLNGFRVSDSRSYINYDENGKTTCLIEYPKDRLPKTVQKYIEKSAREKFCPDHETKYGLIEHWIYR